MDNVDYRIISEVLTPKMVQWSRYWQRYVAAYGLKASDLCGTDLLFIEFCFTVDDI